MTSKTALILAALIISITSFSQIAVKPQNATSNPLDSLIQNLVTDGIILKSYSINQSEHSEAIGSFEDSTLGLGLEKGIILSSGSVRPVFQKNDSSKLTGVQSAEGTKILKGKDHEMQEKSKFYQVSKGHQILELEAILGARTFDGLRLELELIPTSDTLSFRYLFGSEEYDEYVGSTFNDGFAFFISGPGLSKNENLAVIPGTQTPISINNVNNGNPGNPKLKPKNPTFYVKNEDLKIQYDGLTTLLEIKQKVEPGKTYVITIVIADIADGIMDSGVLIENSSIMSYSDSYVAHFSSNSSSLNQDALTVTETVAKKLIQKPKQRVLITGHTDADGSSEYNLSLAEDRVNEIVDELNYHGIPTDQIITSFKGESMPIADNFDNTEKGKNRRVEMRILGENEWIDEMIEPKTQNVSDLSAQSNPFQNELYLNYSLTSVDTNTEIAIIDAFGKLIKRIKVLGNDQGQVLVPTSHWSSGKYNCSLIENNKISKTIKVLKTN
ncbi:MAG: OmpA family protein [Flavobacteriales bacterium]|nr:OmpA family protein [Flavobacteriales bacterium]